MYCSGRVAVAGEALLMPAHFALTCCTLSCSAAATLAGSLLPTCSLTPCRQPSPNCPRAPHPPSHTRYAGCLLLNDMPVPEVKTVLVRPTHNKAAGLEEDGEVCGGYARTMRCGGGGG